MNTLWINLSRRRDRWDDTVSELAGAGLLGAAARIDAVDGQTLDLEDVDLYRGECARRGSTMEWSEAAGQLGKLRSHRAAVEVALADDAWPTLVLEDDARLAPQFADLLDDLLRDSTREMLVLAGHGERLGTSPRKVNVRLVQVGRWRGTAGYLLRNRFVAAVLRDHWSSEHLEADRLWWPVIAARGVVAQPCPVLRREHTPSDIVSARVSA